MQRSRQLQLEVQLTYSMAEDNISLNILTKPQFREWIQNGMAGYKLPSTERMRNVMLPKLVAATKQRSLELLKSCTSLNIILDIWSSKQMMGIKHMPGRHTAANVFAEYEQIIGEWQIPFQSISQDKTDGGSNVVANTFYIPIPGWKEFEDVSCVRDYTENFDDGSITSAPAVSNGNGDEEDMRDWKSTLSRLKSKTTMIGTSSTKVEAASSVKKAGKIVSYIRKSVLDTEKLFKAVGFRLPNENATRWNSQYLMLRKLLEAFEKASYLQETLNATKKLGKLSAYELLVLKELVALLKPFKQASDDFQDDFESIGNVIPSFLGLRTTLCLKIKDRHGVEVPNPASTLSKTIKHLKNVAATLEKSLASRFSYVLYDFYYVLGALLDPPFKKLWIKRSEHSDSDILSAVKVQLEARYRHYRDCKYFATGQIASDDEVVEAPAEESEVLEEPCSQSIGPGKIIEFEAYLTEPNVPFEQPSNPHDPESKLMKTRPLQFWKTNSHRFSFLSVVARDSLSVPASSGAIERSYSTGTDILCAKRNRTKPDLFSNLMFIKCNAKVNATALS
ncbi:Uncharacterized protein APZ42_029636 [Daphnia magna]|uniref:HAT C-terminal dimerisation domain-containing protein n=1 Tax=Daphnia magna TaxID=35525 RepID=A0A164PFM5_9CRUS|nr:Uncharacterized protein APZ42_029636 [Daphnia magna]